MCFTPQRRALFRHLNFQKLSDNGVFCTFWLRNVLLNFQKWSDAGVSCTFWLRNVLRATTACTFSTSQLPRVVRQWCVLYILTSKCASRHNGVEFFISPLASWLRTRRFSEPTFRPSGATNHWKNIVIHDFPTFLRICIFFLLTLSLLLFSLLTFLFSLPLPCYAFHLTILSEVWLLNFLPSWNFRFNVKGAHRLTSLKLYLLLDWNSVAVRRLKPSHRLDLNTNTVCTWIRPYSVKDSECPLCKEFLFWIHTAGWLPFHAIIKIWSRSRWHKCTWEKMRKA